MPKPTRDKKVKAGKKSGQRSVGSLTLAAGPSKKRPRKTSNLQDLYEAEDEQAEEERRAQKFDDVENYEYEMPSDFEDEEIDEELAFTEEDKIKYAGWFDDEGNLPKKKKAKGEVDLLANSSEEDDDEDEDAGGEDDWLEEEEDGQDEGEEEDIMPGIPDEEEEEDDEDAGEGDDVDGDDDPEKHRNMLQQVLGKVAAKQQQKLNRNLVVSETVPESEFNVNPVTASGGDTGALTVEALLSGLGDAKKRLGAAGKMLSKIAKNSAAVSAPLPRNIRATQERKAAYQATTKDVSKWQPIVKANREAPTLKFSRPDSLPQTSTTAAVVAKFTPQTDMEAEVAALLAQAGVENAQAVMEAEQSLALKTLTVEEARARQEKLSRMRNLLFYHELKAKRMKTIKSKEYHRKLNKAAKRAAAAVGAGGEADKEEQRKALEAVEFERAKERLTLKHKNTSRWARRALKRGVNMQDQGTREALEEQLRLGQELRKKVLASDGKDSDDDSDATTSGSDDDDDDGGDNAEQPAGRSSKAKTEALEILAGAGSLDESQLPSKGLFALPFMKRAMTQQKQTAENEARELLKELQQEGEGDGGALDFGPGAPATGRFGFGGMGTSQRSGAQEERDMLNSDDESDENEDLEARAERLQRRLEASTSGRSPDPNPGTANPPKLIRSKQSKSKGRAATGVLPGNKDTRQAGDADLEAFIQPGSRPAILSSSQDAAAPSTGGTANGVTALGDENSKSAAKEARQGKVSIVGSGRNTEVVSANGTAVAPAGNGKASSAPAGGSLRQGAGSDGVNNGSESQLSFVASGKFAGAREGYVFRSGAEGVGYYLDGSAAGAKASMVKGGSKPTVGQHSTVQQRAEGDGDEDNDGDVGALMQPTKNALELSQADLVKMAFAGDNVVSEFAKDKAEEVGAELPKVSAPSTLPGWGKWANQKKEPKWMLDAREKAQKQRDAAAAARKDANMKMVVISEKWDKKAAKFTTPQVPFPFNSKDVYERTLRQPLGREFNTDKAFRDLTRPAILKSPGVVIEPIQYSKPLAEYARSDAAKARSVVTVAGGMPTKRKK